MLVSSIVATTADTEGLMSYNFLLYYRKLIFYKHVLQKIETNELSQ